MQDREIGRARRVGIAHRHVDRRRGVLHRIEHRQILRAFLGRAIERTVGVDGRIASVGADRIVQIGLRVRPVPQRHDEVALDPLRALRRGRRHGAGGNPVGPVGEQFQRALGVEPADVVDHVGRRLTRLDACLPGLDRAGELAQLRLDRAGRGIAQLMAGEAAIGLDDVEPLSLGFQGFRHAVAVGAGPREIARRRHCEHRIPVERRIILRRRLGVRRGHRLQIDDLARRALDLGGVDERIAAHPDIVGRGRQFGDDIAAALIGHDDLGEFGRQPGRLGDDPGAGFGSLRPGHDAADRLLVDANAVTRLLRAGGARQGEKCEGQGERNDVACHSRPPGFPASRRVLREAARRPVKPASLAVQCSPSPP